LPPAGEEGVLKFLLLVGFDVVEDDLGGFDDVPCFGDFSRFDTITGFKDESGLDEFPRFEAEFDLYLEDDSRVELVVRFGDDGTKNICVDTEDLVLHVDDERGLLLPRHVQRLLALLGLFA